MKTKIIYISGNEIFDMADIRAAFDEVRMALNLDKTTVLFGVPVDADDAGLMTDNQQETIKETEPVIENIPEPVEIQKEEEIIAETPEEIVAEEPVIEEETIVEEAPKKRGRKRKEEIVTEEPVAETTKTTDADEKVVPILSVLSTKSESDEDNVAVSKTIEEIEIIPEISEEKTEEIIEEVPTETEEQDDDEEDLEKLLSAMTPLAEDVLDAPQETEEPVIEQIDTEEDVSVDATLEQLATEFAETQDKITSENKSSSRSKIGKLRNILPFKQSKHKDQGFGDLFGWAGVAANDEDFSVPGFFTNAASKK